MFDLAMNLFGCLPGDPKIAEFLQSQGQDPSVATNDNHGERFSIDLKNVGIKLTFGKGSEGLAAMTFIASTDEPGWIQFPEAIAEGIKLSDSREQIRRVLGHPLSTESTREANWDIFEHNNGFVRIEYQRPTDEIRHITLSKTRPPRESRFSPHRAVNPEPAIN